MGIQPVLSPPRWPWQRAYVERVIGTLRRECLDHVIVFNEASLYRHVKSFRVYYPLPAERPLESSELIRQEGFSENF